MFLPWSAQWTLAVTTPPTAITDTAPCIVITNIRNTLARLAFRAAGVPCDFEVPFLIPGTAHRPADLLVQPAPPPAGALPDRPTAYDVTFCNPYAAANLLSATRSIAGAAEAAHT